MKIRTLYFKVSDMERAVAFWKIFLDREPHKAYDDWYEFMVGDTRLALLLSDDKFHDARCVPVFEFDNCEIHDAIETAKQAGASVISNGLDDPDQRSIVFHDVCGNEFELTTFHD